MATAVINVTNSVINIASVSYSKQVHAVSLPNYLVFRISSSTARVYIPVLWRLQITGCQTCMIHAAAARDEAQVGIWPITVRG
jgi:hypothetical protein